METLYSIFIVLVIISGLLGVGFISALMLEKYPNSWVSKKLNKGLNAKSQNESDL